MHAMMRMCDLQSSQLLPSVPSQPSAYPIETQIAVMYRGASGCLTMKLPAIPPAPLNAVTVAAVNTLFPKVAGTKSVMSHNALCTRELLTLSDDIIRLIRRHTSPVGHVCTGREVCADIAHSDLVRETEHAKADDQTQRIEDDNRAPKLVLVADKRGHDGGNDGVVVGWR
jgi:hypothetical protein